MLPADFESLVRYHDWASRRLLDTAALLTPTQLETGALSQGTLLATLRHVADVSQSWLCSAAGEPDLTEQQMEQFAGLASLRAFWLAEDERLLAFVRSVTDLNIEVTPSSKKRPYKICQVLFHIVNHRMDHGNEIGWYMTRLGHSPGEMGFVHYLDLHLD